VYGSVQVAGLRPDGKLVVNLIDELGLFETTIVLNPQQGTVERLDEGRAP